MVIRGLQFNDTKHITYSPLPSPYSIFLLITNTLRVTVASQRFSTCLSAFRILLKKGKPATELVQAGWENM